MNLLLMFRFPMLFFIITSQQPLNGSSKFSSDVQKNLCADFPFTAFYIGKVTLAYSNGLREVPLGHVESSEFPDSLANFLPVKQLTLVPRVGP